MILVALMLMQAFAHPTLAEVMQLQPVAAGDLVLSGQEHGPVEEVVVPPARGLQPPGLAELELVEQAGAAARDLPPERSLILM